MSAPIPPPSYAPLGGMKVDANGRVTFDFEGHVRATGLELAQGDGQLPSTQQAVEWINGAGADVADAYSGHFVVGPPVGSAERLQLRSRSADGTREAGIRADVFNRDDTVTVADVVSAYAGAFGVTLVDSNGPRVLQRAVPGSQRVSFGAASLTFPGTQSANPVDVAHGLGVVPALVFLSEISAGPLGNQTFAWDSATSNATTFRAGSWSSGASTSTVPFAWLAIG